MSDWLADQVFYEIFPDRFAIGGGLDVTAKAPHLPPDAELRTWNDLPAHPPRGRDWFGGDLAGVTERLDHILALGATALYLTPVFAAASNHRYDTTDFDRVDPALGGDAALGALLDACAGLDLRVVLDAVLNHVSDTHPWAVEKRGVLQRDGRVQRWRGFGHMPELDLDAPHVRAALLDGDDALLRRWVRRGAAGWRLDVAADLEASWLRAITHAVKSASPEACVVAEVMSYPAGLVAAPGLPDGTMNYVVRRALLDWMNDPAETPASVVTALVAALQRDLGIDGLLRSWMMLSSHDTPRVLDACGDLARARLATTLQFTLAGPPVIYYGEEVGMRGGEDPANRAPMPWDRARWDLPTLAFHKELIALRRLSRALRRGRFVDLSPFTGPGVLAFLRETDDPEETVLVAAHLGPLARTVNLYLPTGSVRDGVRFTDLLVPEIPDGSWTKDAYVESGRVRVTLPPGGARVLGADAGYIRDYRFYNKR
jgi:alpha-glucosidase